jgi:hypothetical protein
MEEAGMVSVDSMGSTSVSNSSGIFKVMCLVSDRQELSFVEKVQLPQDQILLLCNELVPKSAGATGTQFAQMRINFNALNQRCLPVVGFYGNKQMMAEAFRKQGFLREEGVLDELEPGLYTLVGESAIFVFYWHEGQDLREASRKDVSCNFIRYLVELSDYLYVCVQGYYPFEPSVSWARTASSKGRRTKKLQINHVKNAENDVRFSDGFNVAIARQFKKLATPVNAAQALGNVVLCDGYNRCAFLTAEYMPPGVSKMPEAKTLKGNNQLSSQINSWLKDGDLNFCRMDNKHFVSLLQFGKFPRYDEYCNFMKALDISMEGVRAGASAESSMEAIQESVVACFLKILPEYINGAPFFDEASSGTSSSQHHEELRGSGFVDRFDQLHQELSKILAGRDCDKKLIFLGSEVKFTCDYDVDHYIYKIEGLPNQSGPVRYGRELILKCSHPKKTFKATLMQFNEETSVAPFSFSGDRVKMSIKGSKGNAEGTFEVVNSSSIAVQNWVESLIPKKLQCLRRNIGFVALLVTKVGTDKQMPSVGMPLIQKILTTENLKSVERDLPDDFGKLLKQFESTGGAIVDQAMWVKLLSNKQVRSVISNLYKTSREEFVKNLESMVRKEFWSTFLKKFESQGKETINLLQQNQHSEEDKFLSAMKREMSVMKGKPVCRFIEACEVQSSRIFSIQNSWIPYLPEQLNLKVSIERHEKPRITWRISELMPKKK